MYDGITPAPRREIVETFWRAFSPDDPVIRLRFVHLTDKTAPRVEKEGALDELWPQILDFQNRGYEVFYFINRIARGPGRGFDGAATDADVEAIRTFGADYDSGLPDFFEWHFEPSFIINTSRVEKDGVTIQKGQALWPVADCPVSQFKDAQHRIAAYYGSDKSVCNPSRVLRLPGTLHQKDPNNPQLVTFEASTNRLSRVLADVLAGVPERAREEPSERKPKGEPVTLAQLRNWLTYIDPATPRAEWFKVIRAIAAAPLVDGEDDEEKREIAHAFMEGRFYRREFKEPGGYYRTPEEINRVFNAGEPDDGSGCGIGTLMWLARQGGWQGSGDVFSAALANLGTDGPLPAAKHPRIHMLRTKDMLTMPDPSEIVAGMLMEGENVAFVGPPKSGKTFLALDIALSITANLAVVGEHAVKRSGYVLYLSGEGHAGMKRRLRAWGRARGLSDEDLDKLPFIYNKGVPLAAAGDTECKVFVDAIQREIDGELVLVVIDTMARSLGALDENSASAAAQYLALTEGMRDALDCTTLTLAHATNKTAPGSKEIDIRGSSGFAGGFDAVWTLDKNKENGTVEMRGKLFKNSRELGPYYFRLKTLDIESDEGAVLEAVAAPPISRLEAQREEKRTELQIRRALANLNAYGIDRGVEGPRLARELTEQLIGKEPQGGPGSREHADWLTQFEKMKKLVRNSARPAWGKRLHDTKVRLGGTEPIRLWFLPEEDRLDDADTGEVRF